MSFPTFANLMRENRNDPEAAAHALIESDMHGSMAEVEFALLWAAFLGQSGLDPADYSICDTGWEGWKVILALAADDRYRDAHQSKMMPSADYQFLKWRYPDRDVRQWRAAGGDCHLFDSTGNKHILFTGDKIAGWKTADGRMYLPKFESECTLDKGQLEFIIDPTLPVHVPDGTTLDIPPGAKSVTVNVGNLSEEDECLEVLWHV